MEEKERREVMTVPVKVNPALREYILCTNGGSDIVFPDYKESLWVMLKSRLSLIPSDYKPFPHGPNPGYIRVALPSNNHLDPSFNIQANRVIEANPLFRCHLSEEDQAAIEKFLMKGFKKTFRDFMTGAITVTDGEASIKLAIDKFCNLYHLTMESITYEMLRKDWYRYRNREARGEPVQAIKDEI